MSITRSPVTRSGAYTADRKAVLLAAALILGSFIVYAVATVFHPQGIDGNNHPAVFVEYANSIGWTADHLGWFVYAAILIVGFMVLFDALNVREGIGSLGVRIGVVFAGVALALSAIRYAVDGVVLKRAVDAWLIAPEADKAVRFAAAETARWLEEASASYQSFVLGLTLILLAALIVWTAQVPRPIGYLLAAGGLAYLVQGWILGESGFAASGALPNYVDTFSPLIAGVWLLVSALRMQRSTSEPAGNKYPAELAGEGGLSL